MWIAIPLEMGIKWKKILKLQDDKWGSKGRAMRGWWIVGISLLGWISYSGAVQDAEPRWYGVQVGAFLYTGVERLIPEAQQFAREYQQPVGIWNQGSWYKLIVGKFASWRAAQTLLRQIRDDGYVKAFVVQLPPDSNCIAFVHRNGEIVLTQP